MLLAEGDTLTADDLSGTAAGPVRLSDRVELPAAGIDLEQLERSLLVQALERTGWNQTRAATLLGLEPGSDSLPDREVPARKIRPHVSGGFFPLACGIIPASGRLLRAPPSKTRQNPRNPVISLLASRLPSPGCPDRRDPAISVGSHS